MDIKQFIFKKIGNDKFLALVTKNLGTDFSLSNLLVKTNDDLSLLLKNIHENSFSINVSRFNTLMRGDLATIPSSIITFEQKTIIGVKRHIDYALECTCIDLEALKQNDQKISKNAEAYLEKVLNTDSEYILEILSHLPSQTANTFKIFLDEINSSLTDSSNTAEIVSIIQELRRIISRSVDINLIDAVLEMVNKEILPLDILGPTLRIGITESLSKFYLQHLDDNLIFIGLSINSNSIHLSQSSSSNAFVSIDTTKVDHNTNRSVIKRLNDLRQLEISNIIDDGCDYTLQIFDVTGLTSTVKSLNRYEHNELKHLLNNAQKNNVVHLHTIAEFNYSNLEELEANLRSYARSVA